MIYAYQQNASPPKKKKKKAISEVSQHLPVW